MSLSTSASDVVLTLNLPQTVFTAGDRVNGTIEVDVKRDTRVTAVRFAIVGKEKARYTPQRLANLGNIAPLYDSFVHYRKRITVFGATEASKDKKCAVLTTGHHTFAIDLQLPFSCPPSFHCAIRGAAASLTYTATAALYRASSSSAGAKDTVEQRLLVLAAVPMRQLTATQLSEHRMAREMVQVNSRTKDSPERVLVEASLYPSLLLLQPPDVMSMTGGATLASSPTFATDSGLTQNVNTNGRDSVTYDSVNNNNTNSNPMSAAHLTAPANAVALGTPLHGGTATGRPPTTATTTTASNPRSPHAGTVVPPSSSPIAAALDHVPSRSAEAREWCSHVSVITHGPPLLPSQHRALGFFPLMLQSLHPGETAATTGHTRDGHRRVTRSGEQTHDGLLPDTAAEAQEPVRPATRPSRLNQLSRLLDFQRLQNERAFKVSVSVTNTTKDTPLSAIRISLLQLRRITVQGAFQSESVTLASAEVRDPNAEIKLRESSSSAGATAVPAAHPFGDVRSPYTFTDLPSFCVRPGEYVRLDVTLVVAEGTMPFSAPPRRRLNGLRELLRLVPEEEKHLPLPSLYTPFLDASCVLEVSFPGISTSKKANGKSYTKKGAVVISSAVDFTNLAWPAPATFDLCYSPPEENTGAPASGSSVGRTDGTDTAAADGGGDDDAIEGGGYEYTPQPPTAS